jgi:hypothetical protein
VIRISQNSPFYFPVETVTRVPTRDHLSIPPRDEDESDPSYFIVYTNNGARIINVRNVAAVELSKPLDPE